ncbi:neuropeptides capa receptor-like [Polistes fuscatus]|uniref:neuropeptides capa receptor-like n=1 Tax=Polistes fuscatus TaxID=30207 RepID=UPI001CA9E154|nr:neuropeptides capa receptor-like [Polistes fuscatus]
MDLNKIVYKENDFMDKEDMKNMTEFEFLRTVLGPKFLPMSLVLPLTTVYLAIFVSGIFGNIATCTVIAKNSSMQTSTNYYLFNLAISDLTLLILGLPNELSVFWQQYPWTLGLTLCKIRAYVSEMSSYVSVLTIVAFSMERYLAICHPLRVYTMSGLKRPIRFIFAAWSIALISALPFAIYTKVNFVEYPPDSGNYSDESAICAILSTSMPNFPLYEISCIVFFFLPMLVILVVYTRMGLEIHRSTRRVVGPIVHSSIHGETRQVQSRKSTIRMLSAVVVMFFLCWAPFHAQRLLYVYANDSDYYPDLNEWLYILSGCLYYFSTTVNPILYNLMSVKYRDAFKQTICCKRKVRKSWTITAPDLCRCESYEEAHLPRFMCSMRYTFGQAKEVFRFTSNRDRIARNRTTRDRFYGEIQNATNKDSSKSFLNNNEHPVVQERNSITSESTTSKMIVKESISTASSSV